MKRNPDGTWRNARDGIVVSEATLRTRWVEAETIKLKHMGLSYDLIAEQITRVGRGQAQAMELATHFFTCQRRICGRRLTDKISDPARPIIANPRYVWTRSRAHLPDDTNCALPDAFTRLLAKQDHHDEARVMLANINN